MLYLSRKLHSLSGLIPAGLFLVFHFSRLGLNIFKINIGFVVILFWIPFLFHIFYGVWIIVGGDLSFKYAYYRNYLFIFQRITAVVIFVFIVLHIVSIQLFPDWINHLWYRAVYLLGISSASFHFANGLFGLLTGWGIISGKTAQKRVVAATLVLFIALGGLGIYNFFNFI
jgi:succinate dehydrogenase / fumarate reductase cytochrome b subunit